MTDGLSRQFFMERYRWKRRELLAQLRFFGPHGPGKYRDGRSPVAVSTAALINETRVHLAELRVLRATYSPAS